MISPRVTELGGGVRLFLKPLLWERSRGIERVRDTCYAKAKPSPLDSSLALPRKEAIPAPCLIAYQRCASEQHEQRSGRFRHAGRKGKVETIERAACPQKGR